MEHLKDINWNHLYYFYEVARLHSIKKASELTKTSSSTISEQISRLEVDLDARVFNRTRSGLFLTPKGELLFKHAKVMFEEGYRVLEKFSSNDVGGYPVVVGVDTAIFSPISSQFIANYWDCYNRYGVVNTLRQADHDVLMQNIVQEQLDWGLSMTPSKRKSLISREIGQYRMQLCCAKGIYDRFKKKKEIPHYLPLIETAVNHPFKIKIDAHLRASGLHFNETCQTDNFGFIMELVKRGRAIAYLPEKIIKQHADLKSFNPSSQLEFSLYAIWKNKNENLLSISTLTSLIDNPEQPIPHLFHQLEVNEVPKEKLKS